MSAVAKETIETGSETVKLRHIYTVDLVIKGLPRIYPHSGDLDSNEKNLLTSVQ